MASKLVNLSPVVVSGRTMPPQELLTNIPTLHWILEQVVEDWLRAVEPYQAQIDEMGSGPNMPFADSLLGFEELQAPFLKCLFSYAFFFVAADTAYTNLYEELNRANNASGLRLNHRKRPKKTDPVVKKIRTIRDTAIAHFPSKTGSPIDNFAAMNWQPMSLSWANGGRLDLERLTFAPGYFRGTDASGHNVRSQDLEVSGLKTAHYGHCLPYLESYDEICCDYLEALKAAMK